MLDDDPAEVYGPGVRAAICYLSAYQHLPAKRLAEAMGTLFGLPISTGTVLPSWPAPTTA